MTQAPDGPTPSFDESHWLFNYLRMWLGQMVSLLGSAIVQFAIIWHLTAQTGSAAVLATASIVGILPNVVLGPFSGALVDRWNRKAIMIISDLLVAGATLALVILFAKGWVQNWHIFVVLFLRSLTGTFQGPAASASTSLMVPKEHFTRLSGIDQAAYGTLSVVAPPLGALLLAHWPIHQILMVDLVTAFLAVVLLFTVKVPQPKNMDTEEKVTAGAVIRDVREGLRYAWGWTGIFKLIMTATLANMLLTPAFTLLPLLVTDHFSGDAAVLGWMQAAMGIGIILGGLILGAWGGFKKKMRSITMGVAGIGIGTLILGLAPGTAIWLAIGGLGFAGLMSVFTNGPIGAMLQTKIPPEKQGRIFTLVSSLASAASPLGLIFIAPIAERFGVRTSYVVAGLGTLLVALSGLLFKDLRTLDDQGEGGVLITEPLVETATE